MNTLIFCFNVYFAGIAIKTLVTPIKSLNNMRLQNLKESELLVAASIAVLATC